MTFKSYVYEILDRNGRCHYVGKADDIFLRWKGHQKEGLWIDNHMRSHPDEGWIVVQVEEFEGESQDEAAREAFLAEIDWIAFERFLGSPLKNLTSGGDSPWPMSEESAQRHRIAVQRAMAKPESKKKRSIALKASHSRLSVREKLKASAFECQNRVDVRLKNSLAQKKAWARSSDEEISARIKKVQETKRQKRVKP